MKLAFAKVLKTGYFVRFDCAFIIRLLVPRLNALITLHVLTMSILELDNVPSKSLRLICVTFSDYRWRGTCTAWGRGWMGIGILPGNSHGIPTAL